MNGSLENLTPEGDGDTQKGKYLTFSLEVNFTELK